MSNVRKMTVLGCATALVAGSASAAFISGVTATADSVLNATFDPANTVDGTGMDDGNAGLQSALHTNANGSTGWITAVGTITDVTYEVNLNGSYELDEVAIWNYIQDAFDTRNSKDITISTSTDGINFVDLADTNGGTIGTHTLTQAFPEGPPNQFGDTAIDQPVSDIIDLGGVTATHVRFFIHNGYTGSSGDVVIGLNEVRFYEVPEPSSLALLGLGGLMVVRRRRQG